MTALPPGAGPFDPDQPGSAAYDPLVPPPTGGLRSLGRRMDDLLRRCWLPLAAIVLLTFALPQVVQSVVVNTTLEGLETAGGGLVRPAGDDSPGTGASNFQVTIWVVVAYLAVTLLSAIGWAAGIWVVTRTAAGEPVSVSAGLSAGVRRVVPMFGWYLIYTVMIVIGLFLCLLPGLYLLVAGGLFSFVVMFERGRNPMVRSFSLVHGAFLQVLGRFAVLGLFGLVAFCLVGSIVDLGGLASGAGGQVLRDAAVAVVAVPVNLVVLVGLLLTYAQARARQEEDLDTAALVAAVDAD